MAPRLPDPTTKELMSEANTLRARVPGQSVMSTIVAGQFGASPRSRAHRLFGCTPLTSENRNLYRGALGELMVGDALDDLGTAWDVLHAVPVGADNYEIDHIVIGPSGVFALVTSNDSGLDVIVDGDAMLIGGQPSDQIKTASFEAERAAGLLTAAAGLSVEVQAVVVIVNPKKLSIRNQPSDVVVLSSRQLTRWLIRHDRKLAGPEVAHISDYADRAATWRPSGTSGRDAQRAAAEAQDTAQLHRDFALIRVQVSSAARTRATWAAAAFVVACGFTWASVAIAVARFVAL